MAELTLDKDLRLALKAQAHPLHPIVLLGSSGLTEAVVAEVDRALTAHSLIKVRVPLDDRTEREAIFSNLAKRLGAARVQSIGKLIVLYRPPAPDENDEEPRRKREGKPSQDEAAVARPRKRHR
jgi:putative YhbY family RNA-binding protein